MFATSLQELSQIFDGAPLYEEQEKLVDAMKKFIISTLKESLEVDIHTSTNSEWSGEEYKDYHKLTIKVLLDGEKIYESVDTIG